MNLTDRGRRPSRRAMTVAGMATIVFSLLVFIGPALGAKGDNANSGTVKIHDATTAEDPGSVANEPWVCQFWIGFYSDNGEAGTWQVLSWEPTGDGTVAASGSYSTSGDGVDITATLSLADGHYRLEWLPNGGTGKHKTFWVACGEPSQDETTPPGDDSSADPGDQGSNPGDTDTDQGNETPGDGGDQDPGQSPEEDVKGGTSTGGPEVLVDASHSSGGSSDVPDTATADGIPTTGMGGILAAIGILLIVLAHAGTRRERYLPTA